MQKPPIPGRVDLPADYAERVTLTRHALRLTLSAFAERIGAANKAVVYQMGIGQAETVVGVLGAHRRAPLSSSITERATAHAALIPEGTVRNGFGAPVRNAYVTARLMASDVDRGPAAGVARLLRDVRVLAGGFVAM